MDGEGRGERIIKKKKRMLEGVSGTLSLQFILEFSVRKICAWVFAALSYNGPKYFS